MAEAIMIGADVHEKTMLLRVAVDRGSAVRARGDSRHSTRPAQARHGPRRLRPDHGDPRHGRAGVCYRVSNCACIPLSVG